MRKAYKKLIRTLYGFVPGLATARYTLQDRLPQPFVKEELKGLRLFSWRDKLIVDVGANRGQCLAAFRRFASESSVFAFEPNSFLAARLADRYRRDLGVSIVCSALGAQEGSATLFVPRYGRWLCDGIASMHRHEAAGWLSADSVYWFDPRKVSIEVNTVPVRTLDSYDLAPALIKLHAQRAEIDILRGANKTIQEHHPIIICAHVWQDELDFLAKLGYQPFAFRSDQFKPGELGDEFTWFAHPTHVRPSGGSPLLAFPP